MRAFNQIRFYDFSNSRDRDIISEIESKGKEYILSVDEEKYINYLVEKYTLEPLAIDINSEQMLKPTVTRETVENYASGRHPYETDVYTFTLSYNYSGSDELFEIHPSSWTMTSYDINVNSRNKTVSFSFKLYKQDPIEFNRKKNECYHDAFVNIENINGDVLRMNQNLKDSIIRAFEREKEKYLKENDFFAAINLKVNPDTKSVFTAPTIIKKNIPQPSVSKNVEFSSEPMMSTEVYKDILKVIYDSGKNMEKKPSLYEGKDEEALRDLFLFVLETRYEGTTATGETFNRSGRADILLKYAKDGSNLFVAECKFWHGQAEFLKAISQLFSKYLTWRDSKVALLLFVKSKDFSNVLETIKKEIKNHACYVKEVGERGESSFSYIFNLPQDSEKIVHFEVLSFHYDK